MRSFAFLIICLFSASLVFAEYDPPEILFRWSTDSWQEFCNIGDQNGDGNDDLVVIHSVIDNENTIWESLIFEGGSEMDGDSDWSYRSDIMEDLLGIRLCFIGIIDSAHSGCWMWERHRPENENEERRQFVDIFYGADELDDEIDLIIEDEHGGYYYSTNGRLSRNFDLNSDGYDDFLLQHFVDGNSEKYVEIFLGGDLFDLEYDWRFRIPEQEYNFITPSGGLDVNGDGYQDLLIRIGRPGETMTHRIFLGGDEVSEEPYLSYSDLPWEEGDEHYPKHLRIAFTLLPDMNGDSYNDWAHIWDDTNYNGGVLVFFGGEEPDLEPELDIELQNTPGYISGGDFNGDGFGDIVTRSSSELIFWFGKEEPANEPDLVVNLESAYGMGIGTMGGVGDYNGDGSDDIVISSGNTIFILSGWENLDVSKNINPLSTDYKLELNTYPNPFNASVNLTVSLDKSSAVSLNIYDLQGRLVDMVYSGDLKQGAHTISWQAEQAGVYFARLTTIDATGKVVSRTTKLVAVK